MKILIAVAVDETGRWCAMGGTWCKSMADADGQAIDSLDSEAVFVVHHVEADVPVPSTTTAKGVVVP